MPASSFLPDPDGSPLSEADRRALVRFLEQSLDQGFRLAIVEAADHADREAILASVASTIGPGLCRVDAAALPGAEDNLWRALQRPFADAAPRCLALWGLESSGHAAWTRQLNVQRDLFVRDFAVPWLLFIHPASRVPLLQEAPDFCDFAVLWVRDERRPRTSDAYELMPGQDGQLSLVGSIGDDPLLRGALAALNDARFDEARDALARFDLRADYDVLDRIRRQIFGARLEREQGHLALAEALVREACNTLAQQAASAEVQALRMLADTELAIVFYHGGRFAEAEAIFRGLLPLVEQAVGREHIEYALLLHNLANVLIRRDQDDEAERLVRESLTLQSRMSERHPAIHAATLNVLASILGSQGKHVEAEQCLRESLQLKAATLRSGHPSLGSTLYSLGVALAAQGRYAEAERTLREVLATFEDSLGREHPDYGRSLYQLASILARQGNASEVERMVRDSLAVLEKALGSEHPDSILSLRGLALSFLAQGKYGEAKALLRETLRRVEGIRGREHPEYGMTLQLLAHLLTTQGKYAEAEPLLEQVMRLYEKHLGPKHPRLIPVLGSLAILEAQQGRSLRAIRQLERALKIGRAKPGEDGMGLRQMEEMLRRLQRRRRKL